MNVAMEVVERRVVLSVLAGSSAKPLPDFHIFGAGRVQEVLMERGSTGWASDGRQDRTSNEGSEYSSH